ncbi:hypothetical protein MBLNU230_g7099t1 [Neophaeotheca triangularis]
MVFTTTNLFKGIPCPKGEACRLTHCIYAHDDAAQTTADVETTSYTQMQTSKRGRDEPAEPVTKRRKIAYESEEAKPSSRADHIRSQLDHLKSEKHAGSNQSETGSGEPRDPALKPPTSLERPVSPPIPSDKKASTPPTALNGTGNTSTSKPLAKSQFKPQESLNPRMIARDPVGHNKRTIYLKYLHEAMGVLNSQVATSNLPPERTRILHMNQQDLIKLALDEEEKFAREQGSVYANVIKNRIAAYKKMKIDAWIEHLKNTFVDPNAPKQPNVINTGLTTSEELSVLPRLVVTNQKSLAKYGYIIEPPTEEAAAEATAGVESSKHYEQCDRCGNRFQAFPERNEEGMLSTNGPCRYHFARRVFPDRHKGDPVHKEAYFPCCNETVGTAGCTTHQSHVFKPSHAARLAAVTPFINTPKNKKPSNTKSGNKVEAVTFDCEMGYTSFGFELLRLTAVTWPLGEELIDVLVRPRGTIVDLNSRYSGIWPEHWANAVPHEQWENTAPASTSVPDGAAAAPTILPIVPSPEAARELLCSYLTPVTPLIGHGLENDLNAVRLCHPTIVDTILQFPHPKGLPLRFGLKKLSAQYLKRDIQTGGDRGHDSLEDARATGDLARVKVGEVWKNLKTQEWKIEGGKLVSSASKVNQEVERKQREAREKLAQEEGDGNEEEVRGGLDAAG